MVILAAALALFPIWHWYAEREDRRLDRVAMLVLAGELCRRFVNTTDLDALSPAYDLTDVITPDGQIKAPDLSEDHKRALAITSGCREIWATSIGDAQIADQITEDDFQFFFDNIMRPIADQPGPPAD